jgi:hypothetical protein
VSSQNSTRLDSSSKGSSAVTMKSWGNLRDDYIVPVAFRLAIYWAVKLVGHIFQHFIRGVFFSVDYLANMK